MIAGNATAESRAREEVENKGFAKLYKIFKRVKQAIKDINSPSSSGQ